MNLCVPMMISTSRFNLTHGRFQIGSRAKRRTLCLSSTWVHMVFASQSGGVGCSLLGGYSKVLMAHLTLFLTLQRMNPGLDWEREELQVFMLWLWGYRGGSKLSEIKVMWMLGQLLMTSLGSSSKCQLPQNPFRRPPRNDPMRMGVVMRRWKVSPRRNRGMSCHRWLFISLTNIAFYSRHWFPSLLLVHMLLRIIKSSHQCRYFLCCELLIVTTNTFRLRM